MSLKFENKTNTELHMENAVNLSVIVGYYDNSKEEYDNSKKLYDIATDTYNELPPYKITTVDGKKFMVSTLEGQQYLGKIIGGVQLILEDNTGHVENKETTIGCQILRFDHEVYNLISHNAKIFSKSILNKCSDYEMNFDVITIINPENDPEISELLKKCNYNLNRNELIMKTETLYELKNTEMYYTNPILFPEWIYEGNPLLFTKITHKLDLENKDEFGDASPIEIEYKEETIGIVESINHNPLQSYFIVDINTNIGANDKFRISCNSKQNHGNVIEQNTLGGKVNIGMSAINNGEFIRCTDFKCKEGGLLLYDQLYEHKNGTVSAKYDSNILNGFETRFLHDFKPNDFILIDNYDFPVKIKKIISDVKIELYDIIKKDIENSDIYLTDSIYNSIESIIYDVYDNKDYESQSNFHNIMPIRGNRKIKFYFGAKEKTVRNITGNIFNINIDTDIYTIYKLWLNGKLIEKGKHYIIKPDKTIEIIDISLVKRYNNYCYFIYYPKNVDNRDNYAFLSYDGYKTNFPSKKDYLNSLYEFPYYHNFSESPNYNYYEYKDDILNSTKRVLLEKSNTLTFSSYISNEASKLNNKKITIDLESVTRYTNGFRLIKYNNDTNTFTVYNQCELVNPAPETINEDVNIITYTINYKDKIILLDRPFGEGNWGRFELFGLKLLGIY